MAAVSADSTEETPHVLGTLLEDDFTSDDGDGFRYGERSTDGDDHSNASSDDDDAGELSLSQLIRLGLQTNQRNTLAQVAVHVPRADRASENRRAPQNIIERMVAARAEEPLPVPLDESFTLLSLGGPDLIMYNNFVFPLGYRICVENVLQIRATLIASIGVMYNQVQFVVEHPAKGTRWVASSPSGVWLSVVQSFRPYSSVQGTRYFGMCNPTIQEAIRSLVYSSDRIWVAHQRGLDCPNMDPSIRKQIASLLQNEESPSPRHGKNPKALHPPQGSPSPPVKKAKKRKIAGTLGVAPVHPTSTFSIDIERPNPNDHLHPELLFQLPKNFAYVTPHISGMRRPENEQQMLRLVEHVSPKIIVQLTCKSGDRRGTRRLVEDTREWAFEQCRDDITDRLPEVQLVPIVDNCAPPLETLVSLVESLHSEIVQCNAHVVVHCKAGVGRTGTILAAIVLRSYIDLERQIVALNGVLECILVGQLLMERNLTRIVRVHAFATVDDTVPRDLVKDKIHRLCRSSMVGHHLVKVHLAAYTHRTRRVEMDDIRALSLCEAALAHVREHRIHTHLTESQMKILHEYLLHLRKFPQSQHDVM